MAESRPHATVPGMQFKDDVELVNIDGRTVLHMHCALCIDPSFPMAAQGSGHYVPCSGLASYVQRVALLTPTPRVPPAGREGGAIVGWVLIIWSPRAAQRSVELHLCCRPS